MTPNERQLLQEGKPEDDGDLIKPIGTIRADFPAPILTIPGFSGSILAEGSVSILAGEGGVAKSTLVLEIATMVSHQDEGMMNGPLQHTRTGNVLYLSYEDRVGGTCQAL